MNTFPSTDTYQGWANRETWATALHLSNDEGLYLEATDLAAQDYDYSHQRADAFEQWVETLHSEYGHSALAMMFGEIGSLWRVDWPAVADSFLDDS